MLSDSFFEIGTTHDVCEDYAVHGPNYAIISDGCSNGGGPTIHSDWGSRFVCKAAEEQIAFLGTENFIPLISSRLQMMMVCTPNMPKDCLTATMLALRLHEDKFQAFTIGDGVVGGKRKDGRWKIHVINYSNAPFYLKYKIFGEEQTYLDSFGDKYSVETYFGKLMTPEMDIPENPSFNQRMDEWRQFMSFSEKEFTLDTNNPYNVFEFPVEEYDFAFVASDGMESFFHPVVSELNKHNEQISVLDALRVVMDFVVIRPDFARFQRNWAFRQNKVGTLPRRNWKNGDDVSVGVIHV